MGLFKKNERMAAVSVQSGTAAVDPLSRGLPIGQTERRLYRNLREAVPIIDAAIYKFRRLIGCEVRSIKYKCDRSGERTELELCLPANRR